MIVEGMVTGSVVHFHWVRTVVVHSIGTVSASGLGKICLFLLLDTCTKIKGELA